MRVLILLLLASRLMGQPPPQAPQAVHDWYSSLPQKYVGTFYATIEDPITRIGIEYKLDAWGQLCDGGEHGDAVNNMLYNDFPFHGKGFIYVSWRCAAVSDSNDAPLSGKIKYPKPFNGKP